MPTRLDHNERTVRQQEWNPVGNIHGVFAKAKVGRSHFGPPFEEGDLVIRRDNPEFVGRVCSVTMWGPPVNDVWKIKVKPIHAVEGRNPRKAHWCSAKAWRKASPLEMLSTVQGSAEHDG